MEINNDSLDYVYLAKKRIDPSSEIFKTETLKYMILGDKSILCYPLDENDLSFQIYYTYYKKSIKEPVQEIFVDPTVPGIYFYDNYPKNKILKLSAEFDHYEKNWDVRSFVKEERKPTNLKDGIDELSEEDKEAYTNLIMDSINLKQEKQKNR